MRTGKNLKQLKRWAGPGTPPACVTMGDRLGALHVGCGSLVHLGVLLLLHAAAATFRHDHLP